MMRRKRTQTKRSSVVARSWSHKEPTSVPSPPQKHPGQNPNASPYLSIARNCALSCSSFRVIRTSILAHPQFSPRLGRLASSAIQFSSRKKSRLLGKIKGRKPTISAGRPSGLLGRSNVDVHLRGDAGHSALGAETIRGKQLLVGSLTLGRPETKFTSTIR